MRYLLALFIVPFLPLIIVGAIAKMALMIAYFGWDKVEKLYMEEYLKKEKI